MTFIFWSSDLFIGDIITDFWVCFCSCFLLSSVNMDNSSIQDDYLDFFKLFITDHKRLKRGSITASHWITDTALKIWLRTEPVHKGLMLPDIMTEIRPSTMYCKYYCNVYFSPFMWKWCILTIYLQKVYFVFHVFLVDVMFVVIKLVPGLYVCTLHLNLLYDVEKSILSCLLFLSRLIYLRRLLLGICQSNIFYIVIFAQLLLKDMNMKLRRPSGWAHAKVCVKEVEKNIKS